MDKSLAAGEVRHRDGAVEGEAKRRVGALLSRASGFSRRVFPSGSSAASRSRWPPARGARRRAGKVRSRRSPTKRGGEILLVLLALGFAAYALWRFSEPFLEDGDDDGVKKYGKWAGWIGRGVIYAGLGIRDGQASRLRRRQPVTEREGPQGAAELLSWPAGTWLVGIAGACIVGAGLYNGYRGVARKFRDKWKTGEMKQRGAEVGDSRGRGRAPLPDGRLRPDRLRSWSRRRSSTTRRKRSAWTVRSRSSFVRATGHGCSVWPRPGLIAYGLFCVVEARYRDVKPR